MNDKLQEQARKYADTQCMDGTAYKAFIAGAESRQAEINELKEALREAMANVDVEVRLPKAEQILKKYEK